MPSFRFVGYAIVSADGMLAAADGIMPPSLKIDADARFFEHGLSDCDLVVHGRNSHEHQPQSAHRKRLILTRRVDRPIADPNDAKVTLWNPARAPFEDAAASAGVRQGKVCPIGGTTVFDMFLDRYDTFFLSEAPDVRLPGGIPVFSGVPQTSPQDILRRHGLVPQAPQVLDAEKNVSMVAWRRL